jgi:hypothetical protein
MRTSPPPGPPRILLQLCCATVDPDTGLQVPECFSLRGDIAEEHLEKLMGMLAPRDVQVEVREEGAEHRHFPFRPVDVSTLPPPHEDAWALFVRPVRCGLLVVDAGLSGRVVEARPDLIVVNVVGTSPGAQVIWPAPDPATCAGGAASAAQEFYRDCRLIEEKPVERVRQGEEVLVGGDDLDPGVAGIERREAYSALVLAWTPDGAGYRLDLRLDPEGRQARTVCLPRGRHISLAPLPLDA